MFAIDTHDALVLILPVIAEGMSISQLTFNTGFFPNRTSSWWSRSFELTARTSGLTDGPFNSYEAMSANARESWVDRHSHGTVGLKSQKKTEEAHQQNLTEGF